MRRHPFAGGLLQPGWKEDKTTHPKWCRLTSSQPQNVAVSSSCEANVEAGFLSGFPDGSKYTISFCVRASGNELAFRSRATCHHRYTALPSIKVIRTKMRSVTRFFQHVGRDKRTPPASGVVVSGDGGGNEVGDAVFGLADERGRDTQTRGDVRRRFAFL